MLENIENKQANPRIRTIYWEKEINDNKAKKKHGQLWHQSVCGTFGNIDVSIGTQGKHTQLQRPSQTIWIDPVVSLCAQFENLQGDLEPQELA